MLSSDTLPKTDAKVHLLGNRCGSLGAIPALSYRAGQTVILSDHLTASATRYLFKSECLSLSRPFPPSIIMEVKPSRVLPSLFEYGMSHKVSLQSIETQVALTSTPKQSKPISSISSRTRSLLHPKFPRSTFKFTSNFIQISFPAISHYAIAYLPSAF